MTHLRMTGKHLTGGIAALLLATGSAWAQDVQVTGAMLSLLPGEQPGAGYFQLNNTSEEAVVLVGAESESFEDVEIHVSTEENGMAHMHAIKQVDIAAGESFEFAPKGHHLMFIGRKETLAEGDNVEVLLKFKDAQRLPVTFDVVSPASL